MPVHCELRGDKHRVVEDDGKIVASRFGMVEQSSNPSTPAEGTMELWMSDGTAIGDDGDVFIVATAGGTSTYTMIHDHSAGTAYP